MSDELKSVDDILNHYKKQETFKRSAEIVKRFGWGGEIKLVEVKKDANRELPREVPATRETREGERNPADDAASLPGSVVG